MTVGRFPGFGKQGPSRSSVRGCCSSEQQTDKSGLGASRDVTLVRISCEDLSVLPRGPVQTHCSESTAGSAPVDATWARRRRLRGFPCPWLRHLPFRSDSGLFRNKPDQKPSLFTTLENNKRQDQKIIVTQAARCHGSLKPTNNPHLLLVLVVERRKHVSPLKKHHPKHSLLHSHQQRILH